MGRRREGPNGTIVDLSAYDEFGLLVSFRRTPDGPEFVEFAVWPDLTRRTAPVPEADESIESPELPSRRGRPSGGQYDA